MTNRIINADENNIEDMSDDSGLYGLVVCGGNSSRMGMDKSMLTYHDKPQWQHMYEMLEPFCEQIFISCNKKQASSFGNDHQLLVDLASYSNIGPMAALLTAFTHHPTHNFIITGCDYPFLDAAELKNFLHSCKDEKLAAAFYEREENFYEPLLAFYHADSFATLKKMYAAKQYSLQSFLWMNNATKYFPVNEKSICSIDTYEDHIKTKELLEKNKSTKLST